ncbi:MAG TPA: PPC domain-containing protein [Kofleriaceae bacterium]|nr:PPC domain-containing protein [Kofleriaceae bacterium]
MRRAVVLLALIACGDEPDKTAVCHFGEATSAATIQDRKIIGGAAPFDADTSLAARDEELRTSIAARRAAAWNAVSKVLAPTPLVETKLAQNFGGVQPKVPAWHTWFSREDFDRVFKKVYRDLGPAARRARAPLDAATIDAGFTWNTTALDGLPDWDQQRYDDYVAAVTTQELAQGLGGISRVGYSTGAMRQLVHSYKQQYGCRVNAAPDAFDAQPVRPGTPTRAVEQMTLGECSWQVLGPFAAGAGKVTASSMGDGDVDLYIRKGAAPTPDEHDCKSAGGSSTETCSVDGGGMFYVAVFGATASAATVTVEYTTEDVAAPTCLEAEMPRDGVLVKADWRRVLTGENLPIYDTSAARMRERLNGDLDWHDGDGSQNPDSSAIYTATLPNGNTFRMPALHIMTKELDHWLWITLWYSSSPDSDFGADRPAAISALPGPWKNYKMCVASAYLEGDADPRGGQAGSLGDALEAVHGGVGSPSWCSNPYLEKGGGNVGTNCIGCHQHGGTDITPEDILATLPHNGSTRVRNNFFTDYLWAIKGGQGEDLSALVQAEVDYWDANDPP